MRADTQITSDGRSAWCPNYNESQDSRVYRKAIIHQNRRTGWSLSRGWKGESTACISPDGRRRTTAWSGVSGNGPRHTKAGIWSLAMLREIRRDTDQTKTLHENTRDRLIKQELNILALFTHTKHICCYLHVSNRRRASQDIFKALLLGFESTVCSLCLDIRKVLESGECEWWQNLQLFMNAVRCVSLWVCGGTAPLESSWDRISLARTRRVSRAAN